MFLNQVCEEKNYNYHATTMSINHLTFLYKTFNNKGLQRLLFSHFRIYVTVIIFKPLSVAVSGKVTVT